MIAAAIALFGRVKKAETWQQQGIVLAVCPIKVWR
jgi:hypothetical protein